VPDGEAEGGGAVVDDARDHQLRQAHETYARRLHGLTDGQSTTAESQLYNMGTNRDPESFCNHF
jgi:hypothetical protein